MASCASWVASFQIRGASAISFWWARRRSRGLILLVSALKCLLVGDWSLNVADLDSSFSLEEFSPSLLVEGLEERECCKNLKKPLFLLCGRFSVYDFSFGRPNRFFNRAASQYSRELVSAGSCTLISGGIHQPNGVGGLDSFDMFSVMISCWMFLGRCLAVTR